LGTLKAENAGDGAVSLICCQGNIKATALIFCAAFIVIRERMVSAFLAAITYIIHKLNLRLFIRLITYNKCGQPFSGDLDAGPNDKQEEREPAFIGAEKIFS